MKEKRIRVVCLAVLLCLSLVACGGQQPKSADVKTALQATDYTKTEHWLSLPATNLKDVDVFYLYPTAWQKVASTDPDTCAINNPSMARGSKLAFARQATAFATVGNIYAPYYRQIDLNVPPEKREKAVGATPTTDAIAAFDYYIKHYNNGRPFILAGHSQGSNVLINLLAGYMKEHPQVYARMIAAYVIGYSVTAGYLAENPHLRFAEGPDDTGVIVSYNTEAPDVVPGTNPVVLAGALVINPITWTRTEKPATAAQNLGSIVLNKDGSVVMNKEGKIKPEKNFADARIDKARGVIICSTADEQRLAPGNKAFGWGVYHSFDYPFYYFNIRENAAARTRRFLEKQ